LPLIPANVLAWAVAVTGSYVMNSFITFAAESGRQLRWRAYGAFVASGIAGVIANTATLVIASWWLPVPVAKVIAILASFVINFSLSHFVVFRHRPAGSSAE
jgi:putative flippase GtrA